MSSPWLQDLAPYLLPLLPITALVALIQRQPYHAVMARGMFGAVAGLTYLVLGAPDVALTEFLMGTLLVTLLYVISIRSSMTMTVAHDDGAAPAERTRGLVERFEAKFIRIEWTQITGRGAMEAALRKGDVDVAVCGATVLIAPHARTAARMLAHDVPDGLHVEAVDP